MHQKTYLLTIILSLLYFFSLQAQDQAPELLFVIKSNGDSLATSKIFKNKSNEDQVVFILDGKRKTLAANDVNSYYLKGRKVSISVAAEKQKKLVKIIARGHVQLAHSFSQEGKEKFYLFANEQWISLDPNASNLKDYLSELLPDFNEAVNAKKIHYDAPSLGNAITKYNEFKDPSIKTVGTFKYTERSKFGVFGTIGFNTVTTSDFPIEFKESSLSATVGFGFHHQYNRLFSLRAFLGYTQSSWENDNMEIKLKTLNFNPLIDVQLYNNLDNLKISAAAGFNFRFDVASKISAPPITDETVGLAKLGPGYDFQIHASFDNNSDFFISYQVMTKQRTENFESYNGQFIKFKTNQFRLGAVIYL